MEVISITGEPIWRFYVVFVSDLERLGMDHSHASQLVNLMLAGGRGSWARSGQIELRGCAAHFEEKRVKELGPNLLRHFNALCEEYGIKFDLEKALARCPNAQV